MRGRNRVVPIDQSDIQSNPNDSLQQRRMPEQRTNHATIQIQQSSNHTNLNDQSLNNSNINRQTLTFYDEKKLENDSNVIQMSSLFGQKFNIICNANVVLYTKKLFAPLSCIMLILIPVAITIAFPIRDDVIENKYSTLFTYIAVILCCYYNLFRLVLTNPGIIPKRIKDKSDESQIPVKLFPDSRIIMKSDRFLEFIKYCETCSIYRPPRSSHCPVCDCCFELHDHHCPWLNVCIAKRNYRQFYYFLFWLNTALVYSFILNALVVFYKKSDIVESIKQNIPCFVALIYLFIAAIFLINLFIFHTILIFTNQTTRDYIKLGHKKTIHYKVQFQNFIKKIVYSPYSVQPLLDMKEKIQIGFKKHILENSSYQMVNVNYYRNMSNYNQEDSVLSQSKIDKYNEQHSSFKTLHNISNINGDNEEAKSIKQSKVIIKEKHNINQHIYSKFLQRADEKLNDFKVQNPDNTFTLLNKSLVEDRHIKNIDCVIHAARSVQLTSPDQSGLEKQRKTIKMILAKQYSENIVKSSREYDRSSEVHNTTYTQRNPPNMSSPFFVEDFTDNPRQIKERDQKSIILNTTINQQFFEDINENEQPTPKGFSTLVI